MFPRFTVYHVYYAPFYIKYEFMSFALRCVSVYVLYNVPTSSELGLVVTVRWRYFYAVKVMKLHRLIFIVLKVFAVCKVI